MAGDAANTSASTRWDRVREWLFRPNHYRSVHELRMAAERGDEAQLAALLDPAVAVVVEGGEAAHPLVHVVRGAYEATAVLRHGMAPRAGVVVDERRVDGQAGLVLKRAGATTAAITIDFTGRLVSVVWVRLDPQNQGAWVAA